MKSLKKKSVWRVYRAVIIGRQRSPRRFRLGSFGADGKRVAYERVYNVHAAAVAAAAAEATERLPRRRRVAMDTLPGRRALFACVFNRNVMHAQRCLLFTRRRWFVCVSSREVKPAAGGARTSAYYTHTQKLTYYCAEESMSKLNCPPPPPSSLSPWTAISVHVHHTRRISVVVIIIIIILRTCVCVFVCARAVRLNV